MIQLFYPSLKARKFACFTAANLFNFAGRNYSLVMLAFRRSSFRNIRSRLLKIVMFCWKCRSVIEQNFKLWKSQGNLGVRYTPYLTHRKLLQMPLADVGVEDKLLGTYCLYLLEKQASVKHAVLQTLPNKVVASNKHNKETVFSRNEMKSLLSLAESEAEKGGMK